MKKLLFLLCLLALPACSVNHGTYTVLSNKIVNVKKFALDQKSRVKNVKGEDMASIIIVFPTKQNPNISGALSDAFLKADGDVMTDVTVKSSYFYIPYIFGRVGWTVEGDVVKTRNN